VSTLSSDPSHAEILCSGPHAWNAWREKNPSTVPDLRGISLTSSERQLGPTNGGPLNLKAAGLRESRLRFATLSTADLEAADMSGADLMHVRLDQANLNAANLTGARLDYANLSGAILTRVNLCGGSLRFATLSTADLQAADMTDADLTHARLDRANLSAANLTNARLDYADFAGANLSKVNLCGACLQHAKNLTQSQIRESTGSAFTILPLHLQGAVSWSPAQSPTIKHHDLRRPPRVTADVDVSHISSHNVQRWRIGALFGGVALVITALVWQQMNETVPLDTLGEQRGLEQSLDAGTQGLQPIAPEARTEGKVTAERRPADPISSGASTVDQIGSSPEQVASDADSVIVSGETNAFDNPERSMKAFGPNEHIAVPLEESQEPASSEPSETAALVSPEAPAVVSRHAIVPDLPSQAGSPRPDTVPDHVPAESPAPKLRPATTNPQSTPATGEPAEVANTPESFAARPKLAKGQNMDKPGTRTAIRANPQTVLPSNAEPPPMPIRNPAR
jgi:uncharacterized protein YjbI with pentapeptide repeats